MPSVLLNSMVFREPKLFTQVFTEARDDTNSQILNKYCGCFGKPGLILEY